MRSILRIARDRSVRFQSDRSFKFKVETRPISEMSKIPLSIEVSADQITGQVLRSSFTEAGSRTKIEELSASLSPMT